MAQKPRSRRALRVCLAVLALGMAAGISTPAAGQILPPTGNDFPEAGLWWELSLGAAALRLSCDLCDPDRESGPTADLALGAYASDRLRVGVQGGFWTHDDEGARESVYRAGVLAQLHPRPGSGLHVLAGVGWSGYRAGAFGTDVGRVTVGAGWDLPLLPGWRVGNHAALEVAAFGTLRNGETEVADGVGLSAVRVGAYLRRR